MVLWILRKRTSWLIKLVFVLMVMLTACSAKSRLPEECLNIDLERKDLFFSTSDPGFISIKNDIDVGTIENMLSILEPDEIDRLDTLLVREQKLCDLSGIEAFVNLKELELVEVGYPLDLRPLKNPNLESIWIENSEIKRWFSSDLKLKQIYLRNNKLEVIPEELSDTGVEDLKIKENPITTIENLDNLTSLNQLEIEETEITTIENLDNLINLEYLYLKKNKINKISGLGNLMKLKRILLGENNISKIEGLENNKELRFISLDDNNISRMEGFENNTKLERILIANNNITEIDDLSHLENLISLDLGGNKITEIPDFTGTKINSLYISGNIEILENLSTTKIEYPILPLNSIDLRNIKQVRQESYDFLLSLGADEMDSYKQLFDMIEDGEIELID